jgi:3-hydroxyisobutyrate dehydrogenase
LRNEQLNIERLNKEDMKQEIGWIGLGRMGTPMSMRLLKEGYSVTIYNRTKGKDEILTSNGAKAALSPSQLIQQTDIVIIMVSDDKAINEIFKGTDGLLSADVRDKIIINMSTVSPGISKEMSVLCLKQSNYYLDAPVSGSVRQAESGELVIMVGGEDVIFYKVKPVLEQMGKLTIRVGSTGSGNVAKLAVNTLLGIISQGLSESVIFARNNGIETQDFLNIINNGAMSSAYLKIKGDAILQNRFQAAFALKHIVKDLRLARESGLNTPLGETAYKTFKEAEGEFGEEDIISIIKELG